MSYNDFPYLSSTYKSRLKTWQESYFLFLKMTIQRVKTNMRICILFFYTVFVGKNSAIVGSFLLSFCLAKCFKVIFVSLWRVAAGHETEKNEGRDFFLGVSHWPRICGPTALSKHESSSLHCTTHWNIGQPSGGEVKQREVQKRQGSAQKESLRIRALSKYRHRWEQEERRQRNEGNQWGRAKTKKGMERRLYCSWVGGENQWQLRQCWYCINRRNVSPIATKRGKQKGQPIISDFCSLLLKQRPEANGEKTAFRNKRRADWRHRERIFHISPTVRKN